MAGRNVVDGWHVALATVVEVELVVGGVVGVGEVLEVVAALAAGVQ